METVIETGSFWGQPPVFFAAVVLLTFISFEMAQALSGKYIKNHIPIALAAGSANGIIAYTVIGLSNGLFLPAGLMLLTTFVLAVEFIFIVRVDKFFMAMVSSGFLMILSCMYSFSVVLVGTIEPGITLSLNSFNIRGLDSICILLTCLYLVFLRYSRLIVFDNMKKIFQHQEMGRMSLLFYLFADVFLLCSTHYTVRLAYDGAITFEKGAFHSFMLAFLLKDALVLILSLVILVFQSQTMGSIYENMALSTQLDKEATLRKNDQESVILSFSINLNDNTILEGRDIVNWDMLDVEMDERGMVTFRPGAGSADKTATTRDIIALLLDYCAHPDDAESVKAFLTSDHYEKRLKDETAHVERMRLSPRKLLECMHLAGKTIRSIRDHQGDYFWCESRTVIIRSKENNSVIMFVEIIDVDEKASQEERLLLSATTDGLTGLLNRGTLTKRIDDYISIPDTEGALYIIDIDKFKYVNDTFGHQMGDEVIKGIAGAIRKVFRKSDIAGRLGGDEFMVFAVGLHDREHAALKAAALNEACRKVVSDPAVKTSVSIGASMFPADGSNYQELYSAADSVLYDVKEGGRDNHKVYGM